MNYFVMLFLLLPSLIVLTRFSGWIKKLRLGTKQEEAEYMWWVIPLALVSSIYVACNNFVFQELINYYKIESYPDCTLYCYVELADENESYIYPCEVYRWSDEDGVYNNISEIFFNEPSLKIVDYDAQVFVDKYNDISFWDNSGNSYHCDAKILNIKYGNTTDISNSDMVFECLELLIIPLNAIYLYLHLRDLTQKKSQ